MTDLDYRNIYYGIILCAFVWGGMCSLFNSKYGNHYFFAGLLIIILSLFLGLRPYDIGADTQAYYRWFLYLKVANIDSLLEHFVFGGEPLFRSILYFSGKLSTFTTALLVICLCFNSLLYSFSLKITNYQHIGSALLLFLLMLSSFCIYNQQINVIRAGLGIMLLMTFSLFVLKGEKTWAVLY